MVGDDRHINWAEPVWEMEARPEDADRLRDELRRMRGQWMSRRGDGSADPEGR